MPQASGPSGGGPPATCTPDLDVEDSAHFIGQTATVNPMAGTDFTAPATVLTKNFVTTKTDDIYVVYAVLNAGNEGFDATLDGNTGTEVNADAIYNIGVALDCKVVRFAGIAAGAHHASIILNVGVALPVYSAWLKIVAVTCLKT